MTDVSVQNERIDGWIPSSATNVIMNWPERIKTQPHDDRDNCFLHLDSKGPCGLTVNNDIDDDSATKHGDSHTWQGAHMPRETLHCPDDEPLRITLAKAILAVSHTYTGQRHGVSTSTFATMLALVRLQCMGHLFVANCIHTSPASLLSSLSPPTERLFIASLCVALSVEHT